MRYFELFDLFLVQNFQVWINFEEFWGFDEKLSSLRYFEATEALSKAQKLQMKLIFWLISGFLWIMIKYLKIPLETSKEFIYSFLAFLRASFTSKFTSNLEIHHCISSKLESSKNLRHFEVIWGKRSLWGTNDCFPTYTRVENFNQQKSIIFILMFFRI